MKKFFLFAILMLLMGGTAWAVRAPQSAAFNAWCEAESPNFGRWPSPVDRSYLPAAYRAWHAKKAAARRQFVRTAAAPLPAKWSAVDLGWVTAVKNQGAYGTCWTFSSLGAIETTLLKTGRGEWNLSENYMARHDVGFLPDYTIAERFTAGGTSDMAAALLLGWHDPLTEEQDPYPNPYSEVTGEAVFHLQRFIWVPARTNALDNATIKAALMDYGALDVGIYVATTAANYIDTRYFNAACGAYYYPSASTYSNHAVLLVGWDDNYPAANFSIMPPGNGAFLIRNSWGANDTLTTNGYNWVSYYDSSLAYETLAAYPQVESSENYGLLYQYDPCGQTSTYNALEIGETIDGKSNWCANVFSSVATGIVSAVGFYSLAPGMEYTLRVYSNVTNGTPNSGVLACEQSGVVDFAGYVTVPLITEVPITTLPQRFSVALRLDAPGVEYPIPVEASLADSWGYINSCTAHAGESFYSVDGNYWKDFQRFDTSANVCLKAYTKFGADGEIAAHLIETVTPSSDEPVRLAADSASREFSVKLLPTVSEAEVVWLLDGVPIGEGTSFIYAPSEEAHGVHNLICRVKQDMKVDEVSWTVIVYGDIYVNDYAALTNVLYGGVVDGDRVMVGPGTYVGMIQGPSACITILSAEGPARTILERGEGTCCYYGGYNENTLLAGFTLRGGNCKKGGGVYYGSVSNCVIENCVADYGGAAYGGVLYDCILRNCEAYGDGGGASECSLANCVISNCVSYAGGGVSYSELANCLVVSNCVYDYNGYDRFHRPYYQAGLGGGAYECFLYNCTLAANYAYGYGGGAYLQEWGGAYNTVVAENVSAYGYDYGNDVYGKLYFMMENSISANATAECRVKFVDSAHGDWHLAAGSPCIDQGANRYVLNGDLDFDKRARIFGAHVDIGCYEYAHIAEGWPLPAVKVGMTAADEGAAVGTALETVGFPAKVAAHVTTLAQYHTLTAWAETRGVTSAQLAASPTALLSPALGAEGLLALSTDDLAITEMMVASTGTAISFTLTLAAYEAAKADPALLRAAVGVEGSETLGTAFSGDDLAVSVVPSEKGIAVTVTPPTAKSSYFLRTVVR